MSRTKPHKRLQPRKSSHSFTEEQMMGLGSFAASSSSSSSNLSPLAPPFTVERSNYNKLNLSSNRDSHFNGTSDGVPFTSPWPNFHSSTARQGLLADSIRTATVPSANSYMVPELINSPTTYNWDSLHSVIKSGLEPINAPASHLSAMNPNPQPLNAPAPQLSAINPNPQRVIDSSSYNRTEPFYYPCVSWSSDEDDAPLAPLNEDFSHNRGLFHGPGSSQVDYSQHLSGLKYNAPQVGTWGGLADGSRGNNLDAEQSFFSEEANVAGSLACRSYMNQGAYDVESLSKGKEDPAMFPGRHSNLVREKNIGPSIVGKSHGASFSAVNQGLNLNGFSKELTFTAFPEFSESHPLVPSPEPPKEPWNNHSSYTPYGTRSLFDTYTNLKPPSITKSLPSVVIKPPASLSTFSAQGAVSSKNVEISSTPAFNSNDVLVSHKPLKEKESHLPLGFEAKGSSLALNQLSFQIGRSDDHVLVDSSARRDASNMMSTDDQLDFKFKSIPNVQFPDINITKDGKSATNLSEHLDHHNPAEDSPCWKGAPTHFSPFGSPDAEPPQHPMKKRHEHSVSNERILASKPTEKDHKSGGAVVVGLDSVEASKGQAQSSCDMARHRKEYSFLSEPSSNANSQASKLKLPNVNEDVLLSGMIIRSTDGIVGQTLHASIENAADIASAENFDVNVIVKALNNLSELLLLHCSKDECALKEQDRNALDHIVGNLNVCRSREIQQAPPTQNYKLPQHISSNVLQEGAFVGKSQVTNGSSGIFYDQAGHLSALHMERNNDHFAKNIEKLQGASLRDIDIQKDHNMVQTIKKVLDENLECKEDLPSHNLLYKNLWLEAEAELCALSYKARFHRVKREMAISEASDPDVSEVSSDIKKISNSNFSLISPKLIDEASGSKPSNIPPHNPSLPNFDGNIDDVESSVMARFNILKRREESKPVNTPEKEAVDVEVSGNDIQSSEVAEGPHLPHDLDDAVVIYSHGNQKMQHQLALDTKDVEHSIMARLNVLKGRGESDPVNVEWQVLADGAHFQHQAGKAEDKMGFVGTSVMQNRFESGLYSPSYNASSDWEHVLKDEFS
ncbi:uncharacterized protein LOC112525144 isoform X3 [Cynara cardunculus var. scolymus]|uniref:uncharacterized protein LOC112525144 isoform X3 n=1 Tax=Cynara cardunculus var. scolymus TaxID=59895 RepID=UPI000D6299F4|nr:uncharacterized protein LOC112525144 isoform X3 [Cynara cardunculus var. scolymus]